MECNAQSLLSMWSRSTLNHVPSHIYVWRHRANFHQVGGNLWNNMWNAHEKRVQGQDRCFPQDPLYLWADLVLFAVTWKTPERNASGYPSLCCGGEENPTKDWHFPLSHWIFCNRYPFAFACSELLHMAAHANSPPNSFTFQHYHHQNCVLEYKILPALFLV